MFLRRSTWWLLSGGVLIACAGGAGEEQPPSPPPPQPAWEARTIETPDVRVLTDAGPEVEEVWVPLLRPLQAALAEHFGVEREISLPLVRLFEKRKDLFAWADHDQISGLYLDEGELGLRLRSARKVRPAFVGLFGDEPPDPVASWLIEVEFEDAAPPYEPGASELSPELAARDLKTLAHELAHHVMYVGVGGDRRRWIEEGLAEHAAVWGLDPGVVPPWLAEGWQAMVADRWRRSLYFAACRGLFGDPVFRDATASSPTWDSAELDQTLHFTLVAFLLEREHASLPELLADRPPAWRPELALEFARWARLRLSMLPRRPPQPLLELLWGQGARDLAAATAEEAERLRRGAPPRWRVELEDDQIARSKEVFQWIDDLMYLDVDLDGLPAADPEPEDE